MSNKEESKKESKTSLFRLYTTNSPCSWCARVIAQARLSNEINISEVVTMKFEKKNLAGIQILLAAGINVECLDSINSSIPEWMFNLFSVADIPEPWQPISFNKDREVMFYWNLPKKKVKWDIPSSKVVLHALTVHSLK